MYSLHDLLEGDIMSRRGRAEVWVDYNYVQSYTLPEGGLTIDIVEELYNIIMTALLLYSLKLQ